MGNWEHSVRLEKIIKNEANLENDRKMTLKLQKGPNYY